MSLRRFARLFGIFLVAALGVLLLGGCAASAPPQPSAAVAEARLERIAVVETRLAKKEAGQQLDTAAQPAARQVAGDLAHFGLEGALLSVEQREALPSLFVRVEASEEQEEQGWTLNTQALRAVAEAAGSRHVLLVRRTDTRVMDGRGATASGPSFFVGFGDLVIPVSEIVQALRDRGEVEHPQTEMMLFDSETERLLWHGARGIPVMVENRGTMQSDTRSVLFEMLTGRSFSPRSFRVNSKGEYVTVYPYEGPRIHGTLVEFDGLNFVLEKDGGERFTVPVEEVSRVKSTQQNRFIFPARR